MTMDYGFGFTEIEHTADWALRVWAPDRNGLFTQAAKGMYWLMETTLQAAPRVEQRLALDGLDAESLLVSFLSELLYLGETAGLGFDQFEVATQDHRLQAVLRGAPIAGQTKEIKAVTYHNLAIQPTAAGLTVTIVFDV
jgi:protein archease